MKNKMSEELFRAAGSQKDMTTEYNTWSQIESQIYTDITEQVENLNRPMD